MPLLKKKRKTSEPISFSSARHKTPPSELNEESGWQPSDHRLSAEERILVKKGRTEYRNGTMKTLSQLRKEKGWRDA